jgi:gliding motility-associated-like protein
MKKIYQLVIFILLSNVSVHCQSVVCPPNIDFENGNYGYWNFFTGSCCNSGFSPYIITTPSAQINDRHFLTTGSGIDPIGGFPIVAPGGGNYSLKLGNPVNGKGAESASYSVQVPNSVNNFSLIYRFAVVFEDPNNIPHTPNQKPRFEVSTLDLNTGLLLPCNQFTYVAGGYLPGFTCKTGTSVDTCYRGWTTATLNLSGLAGHTIVVTFSTGDCDLGGHFGYGYVDLSCSLFEISYNPCNTSVNQTLSAPPGYMQYTWYDSNYVNIIGTGDSINVPAPQFPTKYNVVLVPYIGNGCPPDTLTRIINVSNSNSSTIYDTVCINLNMYTYTNSGVYIDTFTNVKGCDSIRTLNLIVNPITYSTINQTICQPNSYLGYNSSGTYIDTLLNVNGCDSVRTLNLIVNPITYSTINQTICQPNSYLGYNTSGTYIDTLLNVNGCDSVRTLNLIVNPITYSTINQTICYPNSYLGYNTSGTYIDTLLNVNGCDSVRTLNLIVNPITYSTMIQTICEPNSYLGYNTSGTYIDTFINSNGCDSIRILNLLVNPITYLTINLTICEPNSYLGHNTSGIYIDTLLNANGCYNIRTLNLLVNPITYSFINQTICAPNSYLGYSTSGTYIIDIFQNQYGCDSVRKLNLIVNPNYFIDTAINLCIGDSFYCATVWQKIPGIYWDSLSSVHGCDSIVKTTLSFSKQLYPVIMGDKELCPGDSILLRVNKFKNYLWNTGDTASWIYAKTGGQYSVIVNNEGFCFGYDTINVISNPLPNVSIQFTQKDLCKNDTIQLTATGATQYSWYSPDKSIFISNLNPLEFSIFTTPVNVIVKGVDSNDCVNYDSVTLYYINCCGSIFVPNAFSPNEDGRNDRFKPIFNQVKFEKYEMKIFNRLGQMVYQTSDTQKGWDGTFNNTKCDIGTYYYLIKTKCFESNEKEILSGDITLLR